MSKFGELWSSTPTLYHPARACSVLCLTRRTASCSLAGMTNLPPPWLIEKLKHEQRREERAHAELPPRMPELPAPQQSNRGVIVIEVL